MSMLVANTILSALENSNALPLRALAHPHYIRELLLQELEGGLIKFTLYKRGWSFYKRRSPRPKGTPPIADTAGIRAALNKALAGSYSVEEIKDEHDHVVIFARGVVLNENNE